MDFTIPLLTMDSPPEQRLSKERVDFNTTDQTDPIDTQNILSDNGRIQNLLKCTGNFLKNKPYVRLQNNS